MNHRDRHRPTETRVSTAEIACARTGPEFAIEEHNTSRRYTLADVRAWVAELDRLGAPDDLPLPSLADGITVTLGVKP
jgi:hypothetical protein